MTHKVGDRVWCPVTDNWGVKDNYLEGTVTAVSKVAGIPYCTVQSDQVTKVGSIFFGPDAHFYEVKTKVYL